MATRRGSLFDSAPQGFRFLGELSPQEIERLAYEMAVQELGGSPTIGTDAFGRPTAAAVQHQINLANAILQARGTEGLEEAMQRVSSVLPQDAIASGRLMPGVADALRGFAMNVAQFGDLPAARSFLPGLPAGVVTPERAISHAMAERALAGQFGAGFDPRTMQMGWLPQWVQWLQLLGAPFALGQDVPDSGIVNRFLNWLFDYLDISPQARGTGGGQ